MAKISLIKVSSEELDRLLGVSKDTESPLTTTETAVSKDTNSNSNGVSSDELDRMLCSDTTNKERLDLFSRGYQFDTPAENESVSATNNSVEDDVSATNNSRGQYINKYKKDHYDVLRISLPKGVKAVLQSEAKERDVSVTNMILQALTQFLGKDVSVTNNQ